MTLIVICAALLWTYVIANFVDTLTNMNLGGLPPPWIISTVTAGTSP